MGQHGATFIPSAVWRIDGEGGRNPVFSADVLRKHGGAIYASPSNCPTHIMTWRRAELALLARRAFSRPSCTLYSPGPHTTRRELWRNLCSLALLLFRPRRWGHSCFLPAMAAHQKHRKNVCQQGQRVFQRTQFGEAVSTAGASSSVKKTSLKALFLA